MIDIINYSDRLKIYVFDVPIRQYRELMLVAASDNTTYLADNYREDVLSSQLFMTLYEVDGEPAEMIGLYQEDWMKPYKTARAFTRTYKSPKFRDSKFNTEYSKILDGKLISNFYNDNPKYLKMHDVETVFFTRNYEQGNKNTIDRILKKWNPLFVKQEQVYIYKKVPQYFYVIGNSNFLGALEPFNKE